MLKSLLLPQGEKKNRILPCPHPQNSCLQSCHPVADRLSGVAARRGRRFGGRKDVRRHPEGSAETGLPPATREKRRACRTDPAVFQPNRAPDVPVRHARRRASIAWRLRGFPRFARCRWRRPACPQSPPSQRDRSRRHKPPNGAPEGVTLNYPIRGTAGAPSDQPMTPRLAKPGRDGSHGNRFFEKRSRATGTTFLLPWREKKQNQHLSVS